LAFALAPAGPAAASGAPPTGSRSPPDCLATRSQAFGEIIEIIEGAWERIEGTELGDETASPVTKPEEPNAEPSEFGDETASLAGVRWSYDHATQTATPGDFATLDPLIARLKKQLEPPVSPGIKVDGTPAEPPPPMPKETLDKIKAELQSAEASRQSATELRKASDVAKVVLVHRHHFSSALGRMCAIAMVYPRARRRVASAAWATAVATV